MSTSRKKTLAMALVAVLLAGVFAIGLPTTAKAAVLGAPDINIPNNASNMPTNKSILLVFGTDTDFQNITYTLTNVDTSADESAHLSFPSTPASGRSVIGSYANLATDTNYRLTVTGAFELGSPTNLYPNLIVNFKTTDGAGGGTSSTGTTTTAPAYTYTVESGLPENGNVYAGADLSLLIGAPAGSFQGLSMSGDLIVNSGNLLGAPRLSLVKDVDYTVTSEDGKAKVVINKAFLETLKLGKYTLHITINGEVIKVDVNITNVNESGDAVEHRVLARRLNVRTGPGTSNKRAMTISQGTIVNVLETENGWARINMDGEIYYVSAQYIVLN